MNGPVLSVPGNSMKTFVSVARLPVVVVTFEAGWLDWREARQLAVLLGSCGVKSTITSTIHQKFEWGLSSSQMPLGALGGQIGANDWKSLATLVVCPLNSKIRSPHGNVPVISSVGWRSSTKYFYSSQVSDADLHCMAILQCFSTFHYVYCSIRAHKTVCYAASFMAVQK